MYGPEKDDRDLLVYLLWKTGGYTNEEIGQWFNITYTTVSHIVKRMKTQLRVGGTSKRNTKPSIHKSRCDPN